MCELKNRIGSLQYQSFLYDLIDQDHKSVKEHDKEFHRICEYLIFDIVKTL